MRGYAQILKDRLTFHWFSGFIVLLALLPLPFGANRPWASDLMGVLTSLLTLGLCLELYRAKTFWPAGAPVKRLTASAFLLLAVGVWAFLQTQSWMPEGSHHPLWKEVQNMPEAFAGSISIDPDLFGESFVRLMSYAFCFLLAFWGGRDGDNALRLLKVLAAASVVYALYGLLMQSTGLRMILWFPKWAYADCVTSTFVNKNSYATYAGLGLQTCLVLLWQHLKRQKPLDLSRQSRQAAILERIATRDVFYFLPVVIVLGALLFTGSRAGISFSLVGCCVLLFALAANRRWSWKRWLPVVLGGTVLLLGLNLFGDAGFLDRLDRDQLKTDLPDRLAGYRIALRAIAGNPWLGFGLGAFENAFRLYRDPTLPLWFQHAHNDYLEAALELGIPAALMLFTAIALLVSCCVTGVWRRRRQEIFPALAVSATATVALHSLVDFSLQMPAIAATYAALLGLGVAQSWSSRTERSS